MPKYNDFGILVECNECLIDLQRRIENSEPFQISSNRIQNNRKLMLEFIISKLFIINKGTLSPKSTREHIAELIINHNQFHLKEITEVFNENAYESKEFSDEFLSANPDFNAFESYFQSNKSEKIEINYRFPFYDCNDAILLGFCRIKVEYLRCPDCGQEISNTPENVNLLGHTEDLLCPQCLGLSKNIFNRKGVVKLGYPPHHGDWSTQKPDIVYTGTDYFQILHPECNKSERIDKKGLMTVIAVWIDDTNRVVLSLECEDCGARNALKPRTKYFQERNEILLFNESKAEWKRVESIVQEALDRGECSIVEFKSSLQWSYKENKKNKNLEYEVAKTIAAFLNTRGGILLIGVDDYGGIIGLKKDFGILKKQNEDGFRIELVETVKRFLGGNLADLLQIGFEIKEKKQICYVEIRNSPIPIFLSRNKQKEFIVRLENVSQKLNEKETEEFIERNF